MIFAAQMAVSGVAAQTLDWQAVEKLSPRVWIPVETHKWTHCEFQRGTTEKLYCQIKPEDWLSAFLEIAIAKSGRRNWYSTVKTFELCGETGLSTIRKGRLAFF